MFQFIEDTKIGIDHGRGNLRLLRRSPQAAASRRHRAGGEHGVVGVDSLDGAGNGRRLPAPAEKPGGGRTHPDVGVPGAGVQAKEGTELDAPYSAAAAATTRSLDVAGDAARRRQGDAAVQAHPPRLSRRAEYGRRRHAPGAPAAPPRLRQTIRRNSRRVAGPQANVGIIELSGKEKEAIELLEAALKKAKEQQACEHTHEAHELELLLVEMYIYKVRTGDYEKALSFQCLKREDVSSADARAPLYRAVIYILRNDKERAKKSYDMFKEVRSVFHGKKFFEESTSMSVQVSNFEEFAEMVEHLKLEIQQAHSAKPTAEGQDRSKRVTEEIKPSSSGEKNLSKK
ncbi:hypothetical protein ZIOFF_029799 [Zingiber officinale]|uniref:Uncharacterized protein n=1 Tax=Zingiber officinale TaxID=94328 RepID=A0A8J5LEN4_ZINOF|nr:hypothetical protein ZIOFF_029799 [Zingiber officinale]